jgi:outer membrane protein
MAVPSSSYALLGFGMEAAVGISQSTASGEFNYKQTLALDLETSFGFDDTDDDEQMARLKVYLPLVFPNLYYAHSQMKFSGVSAGLTYAGVTVGDGLDTMLEIVSDDYALFYEVPFVGLVSGGIIKAEFGINVRVLTIDAEVGTEEDTDFSVPIPQLYVSLELDVPTVPIILQAEVRTLSIDDDNECSSYTARIHYNIPITLPIGDIFIAVGYTKDIYKIDADDVVADTEFETYFVEAGYKF